MAAYTRHVLTFRPFSSVLSISKKIDSLSSKYF